METEAALADAACPELPHEGQLTLCSLDSIQWVNHTLTGEQCVLPSSDRPWALCYDEHGFAFIDNGVDMLWMSGQQPLFSMTLHKATGGKLFVKHRTTGQREWLQDIAMEYFDRNMAVTAHSKETKVQL